jgi:hypothetical protein
MTEEQIALARRAVACRGWRWMEGMGVVDGDGFNNRVALVEPVDMYGDGAEVVPFEMVRRLIGESWCAQWREYGILPDLSDPATLGCLLALVREAFPGCHAEPNGAPEWDGYDEAERDNWWAVFTCGPHRLMANGATEAEALVAALEAAP